MGLKLVILVEIENCGFEWFVFFDGFFEVLFEILRGDFGVLLLLEGEEGVDVFFVGLVGFEELYFSDLSEVGHFVD